MNISVKFIKLFLGINMVIQTVNPISMQKAFPLTSMSLGLIYMLVGTNELSELIKCDAQRFIIEQFKKPTESAKKIQELNEIRAKHSLLSAVSNLAIGYCAIMLGWLQLNNLKQG